MSKRFLLPLLFLTTFAFGQTDSLTKTIPGQYISQDTSEIYQIVDKKALFPGCVKSFADDQKRLDCTNQQLLQFAYRYIKYPEQALEDSIEGQVVARFVIEKNGLISNAEILKDIGKGCGDEVLRVIYGMNQIDTRWTPAVKDGLPVRSSFTFPVRFRMPDLEAPKFSVYRGDTLWAELDKLPEFEGGQEGLLSFIEKELIYPVYDIEDCKIGQVEMQLLIRKDGNVYITDILDYGNLGIDFLYEAVNLGRKTVGQWKIAEKNGKPATTPYTLRLFFQPPGDLCQQKKAEYEQAQKSSREAILLFEEGKEEEAIEKWNSAVGLFPDNAEFLSLRGQAFVEVTRLSEACADLKKAQQLLGVNWYRDLLSLICGVKDENGTKEETKTIEKQ